MQVTQIENYSSSPRELDRAAGVPQSRQLAQFNRSDQELLLAVRTRSSVAFEELQKLYSKRLYKRILLITRNHEDAEDALQDTFMRAFLAFDSFRGQSHVSTWLTRIAVNSALMVIRRRCRAYAEVSLTPPSKSEADFQEFDVRDSAPTPEEICDLNQRFDRMFSAIERLDPTLRNTIGIQITQEYSMKEIARTLDLSVGAVKARLHRARKKLAEHLNHRSLRRISPKQRRFELRIDRQLA